ncbi:hypothetical protein HNR46_000321 [Haloferula luteola]|uniref:LTD domain-containing protein n=1 Tax=Haloferula luteola TaxID=595692 RepID=A0A840V817_9BACT|nr:lamin tail domain-containing protein [Haloferula luteola]MBB5350100.1 hypothetical protein [Haloferula luteola]
MTPIRTTLLAALAALPASGQVVINEMIASTTGTDSEFIELYNTSGSAIDLTGWTIEVFDSNNGESDTTYGANTLTLSLDGATIPANGFYLLGSAEFTSAFQITPDATFANDSLMNASCTVILRDSSSAVAYAAFLTDADTETDTANDGGVAITPNVTVGPDGTFFPAGYTLVGDGGTSANPLEFSPKPAPSATPTTSLDEDPPVVLSLSPANGVILASAPTEILMSFNEAIMPGATGSITLYDAADDSVVEAFDINSTSGNVILFGKDVYLAPTVPLELATEYYILIDSGTILDLSGNAYEGISATDGWTFATAGLAVLDNSGPYTEDFASFVSSETVPEGWTFEGADLTYDGDWNTGTTGGFRGNASVLGYQHSSSTGILVEKLTLLNDTGSTITDLTISYDGRVSRADQTRVPQYEVAVDGVTIASLHYSTAEGDGITKTGTVSDLAIEDGATVTLTWTSDRGLSSGSSKQIGISNVSVEVGSTALPPTVSTTAVDLTSVTTSGASVSSETLSEGSAEITTMGFVVAPTSVDDTPEIGETGVTDFPSEFAGVFPFDGTLTGLTASTSYTVRAYATNSVGTTYGATAEFLTLDPAPSFTGTYSEPFDAFDGTFPAGWTGISTGGSNSFGGDWGSGSSAGFRGNMSSPGVVGYQHTSTSQTLELTLRMVNDTGSTLTALNFYYLGQVARVTETRSPIWTVSLNGTEVPELSYSTEDGVNKAVTASLSGLSIPAGAEFELVWSCDRGLTTGASKQIGMGELIISTEEIVVEEPGFADWATTNGVTLGASGDDDGDGIANLIEYALGLDPQVADGSPGSFDGSLLSFTKSTEERTDITYSIEVSTDLGVTDPWVAVTPDTNDTSTIAYTLPEGSAKLFARLVVTQN